MEKIEEGKISMPGADRNVPLETDVQELDQSFKSLGFVDPEDLDQSATPPENREVEPAKLDETVKAAVSRKKKAMENEGANMPSTSAAAYHCTDEADEAIKEAVDAVYNFDALPGTSQQQVSGTSRSRWFWNQEMSAMAREEATAAAQVVQQENPGHQFAHNAGGESNWGSHGYCSEFALRGVLACFCGNKYPTIESLSAHIYNINMEHRFPCGFCGWQFANLTDFVKHVKSSHTGEGDPRALEGQRRTETLPKKPKGKAKFRLMKRD